MNAEKEVRLNGLELNQWENYLRFVKNPDNYKEASQTLSIGSTDGLAPAEYANLFGYLPQYRKLVKKYIIPKLENRKTVFGKALAIMHWLTQNTFYSGAQTAVLPDDSLKILDYAFGQGFDHAINCRYKAILLTDLLIAHGIMAYPIALEDGNHWGGHFVVHVFCPDENKWVVLDPSFNCCFQDKSNTVLNIFELRDLRLRNQTPAVIGYSFNGTDACMDIYLQYFVGVTLTHITTWESNSNDGRNTTDICRRKAFRAKLPKLDAIQDYIQNN